LLFLLFLCVLICFSTSIYPPVMTIPFTPIHGLYLLLLVLFMLHKLWYMEADCGF
jgi:hypothetical protein